MGYSQHACVSRGVLAKRVCLASETLETNPEKILRKILTKKFGKKNLKKKFYKKILIDIITRKIPRGVLATRVCLAWGTRKTRVSRVQNPRNKSRKNFEENFEKKILKKKLEKKIEKNSEKKF